MKIYLDLEANAVTNEVISIGMVTENGDEFYSLVRPHTKLDRKIKELTHISQEDADAAPSLEVVMQAVRRFLCIATPLDEIVFIHYGMSDIDFLHASQTFAERESTKVILQYIINRCENVDKYVPQHFGRDTIGLRSAYLTMRLSSNEPAIQNHNALEDAQMLKYVWENIDDYILPEGVEVVKVARFNMRYGKGKKKKATQYVPKTPMDKLTAKKSGTRHRQAATIIPAIDDKKYQIAVRATKRKKNKKISNEYEAIYHAIGLLKNGKYKTAQDIFDAVDSIYNALDTGKKINGWSFERVEK